MQHADTTRRPHSVPGRPAEHAVARPAAHRQDRQGNHRLRLGGRNDARALYLDAAKYCDGVNDRVSKNLFEELTADEEKHIDFLEAQLTLIEQLGEPLYAQKHVGELEG